MADMDKPPSNDFDIIIVGAGISGINAAYRVQTQLPGASYTILEARGGIGGTWDFFRYPGIRSDSDLHTFGFPWRPWIEQRAIAEGDSIRKYIRESAALYGIDRKVQFRHKLISANWSSTKQEWALVIDAEGEKKYYRGRFVFISTGYYDYEEPLPSVIPGLDSFKGLTVHPQFWPESLDYKGKKVTVIGSGATTITLIPILAETASRVTMLQRSPSYVLSLPAIDPSGTWIRRLLPSSVAHPLVRFKNLLLGFLFFQFVRRFPNAGRRIIKKATVKQLPPNIPHDPHFEPKYNPWEQRMCISPDGDFFKSLKGGKVDIVTGVIKTVTEKGIDMESGQSIDADVIVTATGLKIQIAGGARLTVDGAQVEIPDKFLWKGMMLQDLPNLAVVIGYTNASWTLGADATARHVCKLLKYMKDNRFVTAVPRLEDPSKVKPVPVLNLSSTYVEKASGSLPKAGDVAPWKPRSSYFLDILEARFGNVSSGLQFSRVLA
ncbi:hypothetical protein MMC20_005619 [Loxospora ochrophaea]|nr:hypothetical protein [Loxospora ochrophaea]